MIGITLDDYYTNQTKMKSYGIEYEANYHTNIVDFYFNGIFQKIELEDPSALIYNSPKSNIKSGFLIHNKNNRISCAVEFQHYGYADFKDPSNQPGITFDQPSYSILNTNIRFSQILGFDIHLKINNITNTIYYYPLSKGTDQIFPGYGANFRVKVTRNF